MFPICQYRYAFLLWDWFFVPLCMVALLNVPLDLWILLPALFKIKKLKGLEIFIYWTAHFSYSFIEKYDKSLLSLRSYHLVTVLSEFYCLDALSTWQLFCSLTLYKVSVFLKKNGLEDKHLSELNKGSIFKQL